MPIYVYRCKNCGVVDHFQHMREESFKACPGCGSGDCHRIPAPTNTPHRQYQTPIEMHSVGMCHPEEIEAFKRALPGVPCSNDVKDPSYGVPFARSRAEKLAVLKYTGYQENN